MRNYIISGKNPVLSLLRLNLKVIEVNIEDNIRFDEKLSEIVALCKNKNVIVNYKKRDFFKNLDESQGICAKFEKDDHLDIDKILEKESSIVILKDIVYKQNLGAIIRSCALGGVDLLVLPKKEEGLHLTSEVLRVSQGGALSLNIIYVNIFEFIKKLKYFGIPLFGIENFGKDIYFNENLKGSVAFLFGSESDSLSEPLLKKCDKILKIPQSKKSSVNSLNIASSVSIIIYEKIRQNYIK